MKLISDIINELVSTDKSLVDSFLKTKVLAAKVKNQELAKWINFELNGYAAEEILPKYRIYGCRLSGSYVNHHGFGKYVKGSSLELSQSGYGEEFDDFFSHFYFRDSISTLEAFGNNGKSSILEEPIPLPLMEILSNKVRKDGNPGFSLFSVSKKISVSNVKGLLSTLRGNLLDFMLKVDEEFGFVTDINKLADEKHITEKITTIMNHTIITNTGDGNVVNTGENSTLNVTTQINKNDLASLKKHLTAAGLSNDEVNELEQIIDNDNPDNEKKIVGDKLQAWMQKMLGKSIDTSWKVGIGVAGKLLADAITRYYGW